VAEAGFGPSVNVAFQVMPVPDLLGVTVSGDDFWRVLISSDAGWGASISLLKRPGRNLNLKATFSF